MKLTTRMISMLLAVVLLLGAFPITAFAQGDIKYGVAFVTGSGLRLRSEPSTTSSTLASASKGDVVVVISKHEDWYKVIFNLKEGYMHSDYLDVQTRENVELGYGNIDGTTVNLRSGPGTSYKSVARGNTGDKAYIIGINNGWYKVIFGSSICYVRSDFLTLTEYPYENKASSNSPKFFRGGKSIGTAVSAGALGSASVTLPSTSIAGSTTSDITTSTGSETSENLGTGGTTNAPSSAADRIVATAQKYLGVPYVWGGASPSGFDCSGFVYYVLRSCGFTVSRTSSSMYGQGTPVAKSDLQPGDVVFFQNTYKAGISHVGIYVGDGQFIHSPHSGKVVSYSDLYSDYYVSHYYGACRFG